MKLPFRHIMIFCALAIVASRAVATSSGNQGADLSVSELGRACDPLIKAEKYDEARQVVQKAIDAAPNSAEPQYYMGIVLLESDKYAEAAAQFDKAIAIAPDVSKYYRALGDAYGVMALNSGAFGKLGLARKSKAAYEKAVELMPGSVRAQKSLINYYWQAPGIAGGGKDKVFAQIDVFEKINPAEARALRVHYYIEEKKFTDARALIASTLKENPDNYVALYQAGNVAALSGENLDDGARALKRCLELAPSEGAPGYAPVHCDLGRIEEIKGDKVAARASYRAALAIDPTLKDARKSLDKLQ